MNTVSFENVVKPVNSSFCAVSYHNAYFAAPLHIHPEYELIDRKRSRTYLCGRHRTQNVSWRFYVDWQELTPFMVKC